MPEQPRILVASVAGGFNSVVINPYLTADEIIDMPLPWYASGRAKINMQIADMGISDFAGVTAITYFVNMGHGSQPPINYALKLKKHLQSVTGGQKVRVDKTVYPIHPETVWGPYVNITQPVLHAAQLAITH